MPITADGTQFLPLDEALAELQITKRTFLRYCQTGKIAKIVHGGRIYVKREWIDDYWNRRAQDAQKDARARAKRAR